MPTQTGVKLMLEPEAKPMKIAYTIVSPTMTLSPVDRSEPAAKTLAGSHSANEATKHIESVTIIILYRPNLSAK